MAIEDYFPFTAGRTLTIEEWNELFNAIRDGSFFLDDDHVAGAIFSLSERVLVLEQEVSFLKQLKGRNFQKHQAVLTEGQGQVTLALAPVTDSEQVYLNGMALSKTGVTQDFIGDYTLDGAVITLHPDVAFEVGEGDILTVSYQYEVEGYA
jgi:hypothetical protein